MKMCFPIALFVLSLGLMVPSLGVGQQWGGPENLDAPIYRLGRVSLGASQVTNRRQLLEVAGPMQPNSGSNRNSLIVFRGTGLSSGAPGSIFNRFGDILTIGMDLNPIPRIRGQQSEGYLPNFLNFISDDGNSMAKIDVSGRGFFHSLIIEQYIRANSLIAIGTITTDRLKVEQEIGVGTNPNRNFKLSVNGKIRAKEIIVETGWSDFVFEEDYFLLPLDSLEAFILSNKHLPEIPTAREVEENGVALGEMSSKLLQKIEELTLYLIEQNKDIASLKVQNNILRERLEKIEDSAATEDVIRGKRNK